MRKSTLLFLSIISLFLANISMSGPLSKVYYNLPCKLRSSNYCKKDKWFRKDKKDGCAGVKTKCRRKFCKHNCFGSIVAKKGTGIYRLCQSNCDPQEMGNATREERLTFKKRFEDKSVKRKRDVGEFISKILSKKIWCEDQCDFDETNPRSCNSKKVKSDDHWKVCAENCYFIPDIKEHAEMCMKKPAIKPKPKLKPKKRRRKRDFKIPSLF